MDSLRPLLRFFTDQPWAIPVIGVLVASLAFLMGRRWFISQPAPTAALPAEEQGRTKLDTVTAKAKSKPERRAAPRRKGNQIEVLLADDSEREPMRGWVIDRSMGGLCLVVERPLTEGSVLSVRPRQAPQTAPWTAVEIRSCRAEEDQWEVGCRFVQTPQWNDLLLFG
jgi:hypothetical protein